MPDMVSEAAMTRLESRRILEWVQHRHDNLLAEPGRVLQNRVVVSVLQARDEVVGSDPRERAVEEEDELAVPGHERQRWWRARWKGEFAAGNKRARAVQQNVVTPMNYNKFEVFVIHSTTISESLL
jgi:hypothetical protein